MNKSLGHTAALILVIGIVKSRLFVCDISENQDTLVLNQDTFRLVVRRSSQGVLNIQFM